MIVVSYSYQCRRDPLASLGYLAIGVLLVFLEDLRKYPYFCLHYPEDRHHHSVRPRFLGMAVVWAELERELDAGANDANHCG
jgi:hypothetical protein